jgi:hypothetical protein
VDVLEGRLTPSTLSVTNLKDTGAAGDGSLRGEIAAAASGDTVVFQSGLTGTVALGSTLVLGKNVTVQGPTDANHHPLITLSGQNAVVDLTVNAGASVTLVGLTLANGYVRDGAGAGVQNHGALTLENVSVTNNNARDLSSDFQLGGGIYNDGTLTVRDSTVTGNTVGLPRVYGPDDFGIISGYGGGIYNGGTLPSLGYTSPDGGVTWVVTFSGSGVVNNSIADGVYDLTLNHAAVTDAQGQALAADRVDTFSRLYGDSNGDGTVNNADTFQLRKTFGLSAGATGYLAYLDYTGSGTVTNADVFQFRRRFGTAYSRFTATL